MWILTLICKNRQDPCELIIVYYIVFNYTHVHTYTHTYTQTHTDTHVRTHAHTHAYSTGKRSKASTNMHSKQAPLHKICRFLWILKAKKLFVWESSSKLWAHHLCRWFQSTVVCAKAFSRRRHLPNLSVCDSRHSTTFASLLSLFRGNSVKAFETAAIEDDAGTKMASNGDRILCKWLAKR